jgi:radical SAM-linked protein
MSMPVQRWRIVYRRGPGACDLAQRDELAAWESALAETGLPLVSTGGERSRPKISAAVPLPVGMTADAEPIEILLTERRTRAVVRAALESCLPPDHGLIDVHDVWLGAPSLPAAVVAADYRVLVEAEAEAEPVSPLRAALTPAVLRLLSADHLPRERAKADRVVGYDLRPFLLDLGVEDDPAGESGRAVLVMRLRVDPQLGAGRPDEVVAAVADAAGTGLLAVGGVRIGLGFADDR